MFESRINGVLVKFPRNPYQVQLDYMQKLLESIENKQHAVLESPTGTGKTLSLLCGTGAWIEDEENKLKEIDEIDENVENHCDDTHVEEEVPDDETKRNVPIVIYASRTHSQISQAMKELKRSPYKNLRAAIVGSRNHLCINPTLKRKSNTDKIYKCRSLVKNNNCEFYRGLQSGLKDPDFQKPIMDIEDLYKFGDESRCCPYYAARERVQNAQIIFMPYNYLLDPKIRSANKIDLKDAIIIFDEAHNVMKVCEQSACTAIKSTEVRIAIRDMKFVSENLDVTSSQEFGFTPAEALKLKFSFEKFESEISAIDISEPETYTGSFIFELFEKADITKDNFERYTGWLDKVIAFLVAKSETIANCPDGLGVKAILEFLTVAFSSSAESLKEHVDRCYKVHIDNDKGRSTGNNTVTRVINDKIVYFWCFSPAIGMQHLIQQGIRCLILTSGTLAPLDALVTEMEIPIPIRLSNPHIINDSQVYVKIVGQGKGNGILNSGFHNRDKDEYLSSIGRTVIEFAKTVPDGLLVFFSSYAVMNKCMTFWRKNAIWRNIKKLKPIFIESQTADFRTTMTEYYEAINNNKGAIYMAVLRGKVSEGLDFADMYGRAVIIVGIPFAPYKDAKVELKMQYMDTNKQRNEEMLSGRDWYNLDAIRAVNQAIGRVIRHKDDYGAILLCDNRFSNYQNQKDLSSWIANHLNNQQSTRFETTIENLSRFFITAKNTLPPPNRILGPDQDISDDDVPESDFRSSDLPIFNPFDDDSDDSYGGSFVNDGSISEHSSIGEVDCGRSRSKKKSNKRKSDQHKSSSTSGSDVNGSTSRARKLETDSDEPCNFSKKRQRKRIVGMDSDSNDSEINLAEAENTMIKFMEGTLGAAKYADLTEIFNNYITNDEYETFSSLLFKIFHDDPHFYNLKGMVLLIKPMHRSAFETDLGNFIKARQ